MSPPKILETNNFMYIKKLFPANKNQFLRLSKLFHCTHSQLLKPYLVRHNNVLVIHLPIPIEY